VWQRHGNGRQHGGGIGSTREVVAAHRWRWQQRRQLSSGGQWGSKRRQSSGGGGSTAAALAVRWWRQQRGGSIDRSSTAAVRQKQAAWRWHLQRSVSGGSVVAASAEQRRQCGSGAATAGSVAKALPAQGRWRQRSGGVECSGSSLAAAGSGVAGRRQRWQQSGGSGGSTAMAAVGRQQRWQRGKGGSSMRKRGGGGSSTAKAWRWQAAWQQRLQHGVSGGSMVAASAEWGRQRGSGAEMAGSRRK
jgi:hypothetical protein